MLTLARLTFAEGARKRVFLVILFLCLAFFLLYGIALDFASQEMMRLNALRGRQPVIQQIVGNQLLGSGMYFASFLMALLALLASVGSVASEIENGLLHAIVSKPIPRSSIILGKFFGYGSMLVSLGLLLFAGIVVLNRLYNPQILSLLTPFHLVYGALIFILQPLVLLGLSMVFGSALRTLTAGVVVTVLYVLGTVGGFLEQVGGLVAKPSLVNVGIVISLVIPSDALFRKLMTVLTVAQENPLASLSLGPFGVAVPPSNLMIIYTLLYLMACLGLALYNFHKKDL
ncbi:ABC transporter permease subunit [Heliobacterium chlorum]|uniref:ABC transporter permease subunit n=1 Tax=Heliobacterium chlorum TaxID=2698 RepID=A0ABR7SYL5_HELCL|nr:ABC transporter permease subunit [Heliobacterium chlorum]MBC9783635.1 ABC transporter permease subunit [Heliobacterium chlorum]